MCDRLRLLGVGIMGLLAGAAVGLAVPHVHRDPVPSQPDDGPPEPGKIVLVFQTEPSLKTPAATTVAGDVRDGRRWVFSFRDPEGTRRAYEAARNAAVAENRRALDWP